MKYPHFPAYDPILIYFYICIYFCFYQFLHLLVFFAVIMVQYIEGLIVGCLSPCALVRYTPSHCTMEHLTTHSSIPFSLKVGVRGRNGFLMSEEQQITEFVARFSTVSAGESEMATNPSEAMKHGGFSPRVARIVTRLVPHLSLDQSLDQIFKPDLHYW